MATENPMRLLESTGARKWMSSKDAQTFSAPLNNIAADELGLLLKGHKIRGDQRDMVPNRSGSAPPNMEGLSVAFGNLTAHQNANLNSSVARISIALENGQSASELHADPSYLVYYCSNVNLNPRLPPPIISRENQQLVHHIGGIANKSRFTSFDDSGYQYLPLSTHNEESEDDGSPTHSPNDWIENNNALMPGKGLPSSVGRHKSLVDLIQEDFPRTPSPVYSQLHSSSHPPSEEPADCDVQAISTNGLSINILEFPESKSGPAGGHVETHSGVANAHGLTASGNTPVASLPRNSPPLSKVDLAKEHTSPVDDVSVGGSTGPNDSRNHHMGGYSRYRQEKQLSGKNVVQQLPPYSQHGNMYPVHRPQAPLIAQSVNQIQNGMEKIPHGQPRFSSVEVQSVVQPPGINPPYATAAAYMSSGNPFYQNLNPSSLYGPQYGFGGYAVGSAFLPPFFAGYPSHSAVPLNFDSSSGQSLNKQSDASSTEESMTQIGDLQQLNKFYGQHSLLMQPSFLDPLQMQYFQQPVAGVYGATGPYGSLAPAGVIGGQVDTFQVQKEPYSSGYLGYQKIQPPPNKNINIQSPRKGVVHGGSYYGNPPSLGILPQFSASPLGSPTLPGSPLGGSSHLAWRNEMRLPQGSIRNMGVFSGWQGQRGSEHLNDPKKHSFLEELKSSNSRKIDLSDIVGRIVEFSVDQHGSRFIQQKLETCTVEERASVFEEVLPCASKLMTDVFGNYVIQKFFEHGSCEQRKEVADQLSGQMLSLSLQMYGCRVIQKALEVIELNQKTELIHELDGHVMRCVRDQNGNHVIQKCIECVPAEKIGFIISAFRGQVATLSTHPYGCRVIQRVLEHCSDESQSQSLVDEILESAYILAQDQYGNYVTQHILEKGKSHERSQIISKLTGKIVQMSQHKFASNVVEKCLEHGNGVEQELLIEEILQESDDNDDLLVMMKDQFANYVVQKMLEISNDKQREVLLNRIKVHLQALMKYTYGKHIVARFEQLCREESEDSES